MQYIIFLRAVNVSGKNIIKMADLKLKLVEAGYLDVKTYIQSGNILLKSEENKEAVQERIKVLIKLEFGLDVSVFVLTESDLENAFNGNPYSSDFSGNKVFITFLENEPDKLDIESFYKIELSPEQYLLQKNIFYFYLPLGMANSKLNNTFIEKKLNVSATGRNLNTVSKMLTLISK